MSMNISGLGASNSSYTGMNIGNKGYKAAEEAILADVMAEEAMMSHEQKMMYELLGGREAHMKNMMRNYNSDGDYVGPGGIIDYCSRYASWKGWLCRPFNMAAVDKCFR